MAPPDHNFSIEGEHVEEDDLSLAERGRPLKHYNRILDWDQRRWLTVVGPVSLFPEDSEESPIKILRYYIHHLSPSVNTLLVDDAGLLLEASSTPEMRYVPDISYPRLEQLTTLKNVTAIQLSDLVETRRIKPGVDAMAAASEPETHLIFKYALTASQQQTLWREMHILDAISAHPNILPLHGLVVEECEQRVLGFVTRCVPDGDLWTNPALPFKLRWLHQLTATLDHLNLELGILHGDVLARNLLVDREGEGDDKDRLLLTNFGSARILPADADVGTGAGAGDDSNSDIDSLKDVALAVLAVYELLTYDDRSLRDEVGRVRKSSEDLLSLLDGNQRWSIKRNLTCKEASIKKHLREWVQSRREGEKQGSEKVEEEKEPERKGKGWICHIPPLPPVDHTPEALDADEREDEDREGVESGRAELVMAGGRRRWDSRSWQRPPRREAYPEQSKKRKVSHHS